ncbi:hypothetical protein [Xanthomonas fragariae]|uniref:hypothetical protein n=1 Tax=Xanthomonas fragariae TaxID=48664 RepID=UPI0022AAE319|nr:hypothetical protein [Xanthomonas fragariae]WAT15189.1 hypothetical protein OZ429_01115 [Xanthomonas fragariae]
MRGTLGGDGRCRCLPGLLNDAAWWHAQREALADHRFGERSTHHYVHPLRWQDEALLERMCGIVQGPASRHGQKVGVPNVQPDKQSPQSVNRVVHRHTRYPQNR